jgi:hypothetical protein
MGIHHYFKLQKHLASVLVNNAAIYKDYKVLVISGSITKNGALKAQYSEKNLS